MTEPKTPLVIFGTGQIAELAWFYFTHDSACQPVAFTVDRAFADRDAFHDLPVVPFDELPQRYRPQDVQMFVALSYAKVNAVRTQKVEEVRQAGYRCASYVSSRATVFPDFAVGENCFILEDNTIQPFAQIGHNVTLWSGNHIGHHSVIEDNCFISSHVVISGGVRVGAGSFIGVNSTIRDHVTIGERCVIGAGSLLVADAEPEGVYSAPAAERSRVPSSRLRNI
ncbi:acetyltransferase [Paraburkholderia phenazinium]|jgi:sugar O-acyltransferase (sialic acid O-acetyltransferase NeuD family)|uniref:Sugar O-acyltransferase, sialic acid O-acetyltransferase NeuD family n=1 Tax=Paraburkholderia phenazinium TaxID=60549 RepID=A0A1G8HZ80_9BURK|nr:acetyltransferase [Paraburkholderia phenazinium]SDI12025.1 sugar O-acyltransferase, sialic acid O-acetyltransferase NeuD family [Paraburkholderia phenazinium]